MSTKCKSRTASNAGRLERPPIKKTMDQLETPLLGLFDAAFILKKISSVKEILMKTAEIIFWEGSHSCQTNKVIDTKF